MEKLLKIGITHGDINGIGYEVILKTLMDNHMLELCTPVIYGSSKAVGYYKKVLELDHLSVNVVKSGSDAVAHKINIVNCCPEELKIEMGHATAEAGENALRALEVATSDLKNGAIHALVTAPINKSVMPKEGFSYAGHTEYFEAKSEQKALMLLVHDAVRIALVTNHLAIKDVAKNITEEGILQKLTLLHQSLQRDFCIREPRIAVLALNPHAGDGGLFGSEESEIIAPAIKKANEQGIICVGPFAADGFWGSTNIKAYDAVLAMYHDQGLAPFKALCMDEGVNFTAGLPFVRTSPDHGTAYEIVGKNLASPASLRQAIYAAIDIVRKRALHAEITANPLQIDEKMFVDKKKNRENA